jgi:hypothetical protein
MGPNPQPTVQPVSQLLPQELSWLWPGRLALGKLAILDGDPGLGKSLVTLDLCARLSTGRPFPDGAQGLSVPTSAIVLNAEDSARDTVRPRLHALGADLDRVFVLQIDDPLSDTPLVFPGSEDYLDLALGLTGARLVVIDPIVAFLERTIFIGSDQSVRRALRPLARLAEKHQAVILLVRHLNKRHGSCSIYRGGGSIGFLGACRSGWLVAREPGNSQRRILAQVKNNLAAPQPSLAFDVQVPDGAMASLSWLGSVSWSADQLLAAASQPVPFLTPRDRARDFLAGLLDAGPRTSHDIWDRGQAQGFSERTLLRASHELKIEAKRVWLDGKLRSVWHLPGQKLPGFCPDSSPSTEVEDWLTKLRSRFPPNTPLDEN